MAKRQLFKKVDSLLYLLIIVLFLGLALNNNSYSKKLKESNKRIDSLEKIIVNKDKLYNELNNLFNDIEDEKSVKEDSLEVLKDKLKQIENEEDPIIDDIYELDEQQIDSTIRAYKHPSGN